MKGKTSIATGREMAEIGEDLGDRGVMWSAACARICGLLLAGDMAAVDREVDGGCAHC